MCDELRAFRKSITRILPDDKWESFHLNCYLDERNFLIRRHVRVVVCVVLDSRRRPRLLDPRERRSSVERWIPEAELVLRLRLT